MAAIALLSGAAFSFPLLLAKQLLIGAFFGLAIGWLALKLLHSRLLPSQQSHTVFLFSIMVLAYAIPAEFDGNGYLSVYLCGIYIGNSKLPQKKYLVHFFDVLTNVAQVMIFFLLGLLVTPVDLPSVIVPALVLTTFLTLVARPLVSAAILAPFGAKREQIALVSWAGLRGAASIVFAIGAVLAEVDITYNLYNLVFCMVLLSISIQGTLLPFAAKKLSMIDPTADIRTTFNDYQDDSDISFVRLRLKEGSSWCGKSLAELQLPKDLLVAMIMRNGEVLVPDGSTVLKENDLLVFAAHSFEDEEHHALEEVVVDRASEAANRPLAAIPSSSARRVLLIKRGIDTIIPSGSTVIKHGDILVLAPELERE